MHFEMQNKQVAEAPRAARVAAWALAGAHYHLWGNIPREAVEEGGGAFLKAWEAVLDAANPALPAGIGPGLSHVTGSGRLAWAVSNVETVITISRPSGPVIQLAVPHTGRRVEVRHLVPHLVFGRHMTVLFGVLAVLRDRQSAFDVEDALLDAGVGRPAYWREAV